MIGRAIFCAAAMAAGAALPAAAGDCAPSAAVEANAKADGLRLIFEGKVADGVVVQIYGNANGPWLLVVTDPSGRSCVAGGGPDFNITLGSLL